MGDGSYSMGIEKDYVLGDINGDEVITSRVDSRGWYIAIRDTLKRGFNARYFHKNGSIHVNVGVYGSEAESSFWKTKEDAIEFYNKQSGKIPDKIKEMKKKKERVCYW